MNSRFYANPSPTLFAIPPGRCVNHSINSAFSEFSRIPAITNLPFLDTILKYAFTGLSSKAVFLDFLRGNVHATQTVQEEEEDTKRSVSSHLQTPPTPPTLHQYFQADYSIGYGILDPKDGFKPPNSLFTGQAIIDNEAGGCYIDIADDQAADVPFEFATNVIVNPVDQTNTNGYLYLRPNRCWIAEGLQNPNFPIQIPSSAQYVGDFTIYGTPSTLWSFDGALEGVSGTVNIAVSKSDQSIVFISVVVDYSFTFGTYLIFENFNASKPDPAAFGAPAGICWDPTKNGPGGK